MIRISTRSLYTFFMTSIVAVSLPIGIFFAIRFFMARIITRDNADMIFMQFAETLKGGAMIRDGYMAAEVADHAYHQKMNQTALDGWGKPFRIRGKVDDNHCVLTVLSAGPDGAFGTADDVSLQQTFSLSATKAGATTR
jgi:hypothetical protein